MDVAAKGANVSQMWMLPNFDLLESPHPVTFDHQNVAQGLAGSDDH